MRDLLAQNGIGGQPDGVEVPRPFQPLIDRGDCVGGIGPKEAAAKVAPLVTRNDGVENIPPAIRAVDIAMAQGAAFQHAELVEQKIRMVAGAVEMPVPGGPFLIAMGRADRAVHIQNDMGWGTVS